MSNKALFKSGPLTFRIVFIVIPLMIPGLLAFTHEYMLFSLIYFLILYYFSSHILYQVDLLSDYLLIRHPLRFWKKDKKIDYSNVIEFKYYSIPRGKDLLEAKYKDINNIIKKNSFECKRLKAKTLVREVKKNILMLNIKLRKAVFIQ